MINLIDIKYQQRKMQRIANQPLQQQPRQQSVAESQLRSSSKMIECTNCGDYFHFEFIDQHQMECKNQVLCTICFQPIKIQQIDMHQRICELKKRHQETIKSLSFGTKDLLVNDAKKTINKTEDKANHPVVDVKKKRSQPTTNDFSKKVETNQTKIDNKEQKPQKKIEQQIPEPKQQLRIPFQKVQQKQHEDQPIFVPQLQEKPAQEQKQKTKAMNQQRSQRLIGQTTRKQLYLLPRPFEKKNPPPQQVQKPKNQNQYARSLKKYNIYNTLPKNTNPLHQPSATSRQEKTITLDTTIKNELPVECIYCKETVQSQRLDIHEVICVAKRRMDRQNMEQRRFRLRQNNNLNVNKQQMGFQRMKPLREAQRIQQPKRDPQQRQLSYNPFTANNQYDQPLSRNTAYLNIPPEKKPKETLTESKIGRIPRLIFQQENGGENEENEDKEQEICAICYQQFEPNSQIIKLECKHYFHDDCITPWLKKDSRCPTCKNKVVVIKK